MPPFRSLIAAFGLGAVLTAPASGQAIGAPVSVSDPAVQAALVKAVEHDRMVYGGKTPVPGVLVGVWDGRGGAWVRGFGAADLASGRAMTAEDHFRIGSNTKTFVISVLLQLVDEGKLGLDDPLSRFDLGVAIPNAEHITIRELCQMRSGLFEAYDTPQVAKAAITPTMTFEPRQLVTWAVAHKPDFPPGTAYKYSNTNYLILGLVIETLTKDTVAHQIEARLITPFHLTQTSYPATQAMPDPWAHGYELDAARAWKDISGTIPVSLMGSAGEMISDLGDMKRWVELYVGGKTNAAATQKARLECIPTTAPGLGFGLGVGCSSGWYGYTGGLPGYNTAGYYSPSTGMTIIAWATLQADKPAPGVANAIFLDLARVVAPDSRPFQLH